MPDAKPEAQPAFNIDLSKVKVSVNASVTHKPGSVRLDGYPLLVYAPSQHGPGIWLEDGSASVADVVSAVSETPDYDALASKFKTSGDHVRQAVAYAVAASPDRPGPGA